MISSTQPSLKLKKFVPFVDYFPWMFQSGNTITEPFSNLNDILSLNILKNLLCSIIWLLYNFPPSDTIFRTDLTNKLKIQQ